MLTLHPSPLLREFLIRKVIKAACLKKHTPWPRFFQEHPEEGGFNSSVFSLEQSPNPGRLLWRRAHAGDHSRGSIHGEIVVRQLLCPKLAGFSPTAESFGVSAQIGSGVVRGGPEVRFHEGSTRVPPGFPEGSTRAAGVVRALKRAPHALGISPELSSFDLLGTKQLIWTLIWTPGAKMQWYLVTSKIEIQRTQASGKKCSPGTQSKIDGLRPLELQQRLSHSPNPSTPWAKNLLQKDRLFPWHQTERSSRPALPHLGPALFVRPKTERRNPKKSEARSPRSRSSAARCVGRAPRTPCCPAPSASPVVLAALKGNQGENHHVQGPPRKDTPTITLNQEVGMGHNETTRNRTAGFSPCYHLPGFNFGVTLFLIETRRGVGIRGCGSTYPSGT